MWILVRASVRSWRPVLSFRRLKMPTRAQFLQLVVAALIAYFTAAVATERRLTVLETDRLNDRKVIDAIATDVSWLVKELVATSATVKRIERNIP